MTPSYPPERARVCAVSGNPLGASSFKVVTTAQALGGIFALAELFANLRQVPPHQLNSDEVAKIADLLEVGMHQFREGAGILAGQALQ